MSRSISHRQKAEGHSADEFLIMPEMLFRFASIFCFDGAILVEA